MLRSPEAHSSKRANISKFFKNPIVVFSASFFFALFAVSSIERSLQIAGILSVGFTYTMLSIVYAIWQEKVSAREVQRANVQLQSRVRELEIANDKLNEANQALEREVPKVLAYNLVEKHIQILNENGDAHFSMTYEGTNISECPIQKVRHFITTNQKLNKSDLQEVRFNNEDVHPDIRYVEQGKVWRNDIFFEASETVPNGAPVKTHYEAELKNEYTEGFKTVASSFHEVSLKTDRLLLEITAPEGFFFANPNFDVRDIFSDIEVHREKDRIVRTCPPLPKMDRKKIVWDIPNPRLSYKYALLFSIKKRGTP